MSPRHGSLLGRLLEVWRNSRARRVIVQALLLPAMPCFMWGPFTHPYIGRRALKKAEQDPDSVGCKALIDAIKRNEYTYTFATNSPDAIATNHVLRNVVMYDYAHNNIPDAPDGNPAFGYRLVDTALTRLGEARTPGEAARREREVAFACGWLSHQLSDWVAHYEKQEYGGDTPGTGTAGPQYFTGYANSHQILGPNFHPDILRRKEMVDHGLVEVFHDLYVMSTDATGFLSPGKNHVELPTDSSDNLISLVSQSFVREGFSMIPPGHLPSLRRDFDTVIGGLDALAWILRRLQPRLDGVVAEFVEGGRRAYVERSVERVSEHLFRLGREEISRRARLMPRAEAADLQVSVVPYRKESLIQGIAFRIGRSVRPQDVAALFGEGSILRLEYRLLGWRDFSLLRGEARFDLVERLREPMVTGLQGVGGRFEPPRALVRFVHALLSERTNILEAARDSYASGLRPVAALDCDEGTHPLCTEEDILDGMIREGAIRVRFTPARRTDRDTPSYLLDPASVNIRLNGYGPADPGTGFTLSVSDPRAEILRYTVHLREGFRPPFLHLFADIHDYRGEHSEYIDRQIRIRGSNRVREPRGLPADQQPVSAGFRPA